MHLLCSCWPPPPPLLLLLLLLQVIKVVIPAVHPQLASQGLFLLPQLCRCLRHNNAAVRLAAARWVCSTQQL
jgi:hypothetical protein